MFYCIPLNGSWQLARFDEGKGDWDKVSPPYPISAGVPGEVHPSLHKVGLIEDPYFGTRPDSVKWVAEKEWWYRRTFKIPEGYGCLKSYLEFEGLDTFATIMLNGEEIGKSRDMFLPVRFDVSNKLNPGGENTIEVRFSSAKKQCSLVDYHSYIGQFNMIRIGARKMQCSFGWDWTPELIGAGIWREVHLAGYDKLSIRSVHIEPQVDGNAAHVKISIEVENHSDGMVGSIVRISLQGRELDKTIEQKASIETGGGVIETWIDIEDPELWWPNGLGEQPMYTAIIRLGCDGDTIDVREQRFGIRTVELREQDENGDPAFILAINGVPVFAKGANWIPADHFPSQVDRSRYRELLSLARDAHYNMLRVWGGGIYEDPAFYELCDEMGIMVWQDFMYTLAEYPETQENLEDAGMEANEIVRRLRNHPSVVLWCGNNECEMSLAPDAEWPGKKIFHEIIPEVVKTLDPNRPFWPSSPYGGPVANSPDYGDSHGGAWFGTAVGDARLWRQLIEAEESKFVSEFYAQGPPEIESIRRFIPQSEMMPLLGKVWEIHNPDNEERHKLIGASQQESLVRFVGEMMGDPQSPEEFAVLGGVLQGEFLKAEIEQHRMRKFGTAGSIFWMFNDTWPSVSYSVVDYYLRPKAAYYYMKRALAPVIVALSPAGDEVEAWVVNDTLQSISGTAWISRISLDQKQVEYEQMPFEVGANGVVRIWSGQSLGDTSKNCLVTKLEVDDHIIGQSSYFFTIFKEVEFPAVSLQVEKTYSSSGLTVDVHSDTYAYAVHFSSQPDFARPDDNYFDLLPGESRQIIIRGITAAEAEKVELSPTIIKAAGAVNR